MLNSDSVTGQHLCLKTGNEDRSRTKLETKIAISFAGFVAALSIITSYLMNAQDVSSAKTLVLAIVLIALAEIVIVERILAVSILAPLSWLRQTARQIVKGNYTSVKSTPMFSRKSGELSQIVQAFEIMRKRVIELNEA